MSYRLEGRLLVVIAEGHYPVQELKDVFEGAMRDPELPADARLVVDVSRSESLIRRSTPELRELERFFLGHAPRVGGRVALVVEGLVRFGLMRMAAAWVDLAGYQARVFRDLEQARAWALE